MAWDADHERLRIPCRNQSRDLGKTVVLIRAIDLHQWPGIPGDSVANGNTNSIQADIKS
jgi:hypothetical protein